MSRRRREDGVGSRIRFRLALSLGLIAAILTGFIGWLLHAELKRTAESALRLSLESRRSAVDTALDQTGLELARELDALERRLVLFRSELVARLLQTGDASPGGAGDLQGGLDLLWLTDESGTVVSCSHWPELSGTRDRALDGLVDGNATVREVGLAAGNRLAMLQRRTLSVGSRKLIVVGGVEIGPRFVRLVAGEGAAVLFRQADPAVLSSGEDQGLVDAAAVWLAGSDGSRSATLRTAGRQWTAQAVRVADEGPLGPATVVVAVDRTPMMQLLRRLRLRLIFLGLVAVVLAVVAGAWVSRRVTVPVSRLLAAVDSIASGEADYTFSHPNEDELDEVTGAFSRLNRSLEIQEQRSRAAERVAAWREVARRVAHEVKNPLVPIRLTVENLRRARTRDQKLFDRMFDEGADTILEEVEQLRRLVNEFSEFARLPPPRLQSGRIHELLDATVELFGADPELRFVREYAATLPLLDLDPDQIGRALKNIVGNAVEAMDQGLSDPARGKTLTVRASVEGEMLRLEFDDNGPGLSSEVVGDVFKPYVTTKAEGTGLGLAITERIINEHGGVISAESLPSGGARIVIRLPIESKR